MIVPLILLIFATAAAAVTAYGTHPHLAQYSRGIELIMLSRRLQWPLVTLSLLSCVALIVLVMSSKRRVWWLVGLLPVLALFSHRFSAEPGRVYRVLDDPTLVPAEKATFLKDSDQVVALSFDGEYFAYPFAQLFSSPVVIQPAGDKRLMLMWSAFANRAVAVPVDRSVKPRDLEIVSQPANTLLLYNTTLGQFINGVTGLTMDHHRPTGFGCPIETTKTSWQAWRGLHPLTRVLSPNRAGPIDGPTGPVLPAYPMPHLAGAPQSTARAVLVSTTRPTVVSAQLVQSDPLNAIAGTEAILLWRDPSAGNAIRAFDRRLDGDLTPRFQSVTDKKHPDAVWRDQDTNTLWAADGRAVDGPMIGQKLRPLAVDDGVYLDVLRLWYPDLVAAVPSVAAEAPALAKSTEPGKKAAKVVHRSRVKKPKTVTAQADVR